MADSGYRQLRAMDEAPPEHDSQSIDMDTCQCPLYNTPTPFPNFQDEAGCYSQDPRISESTSHINVPIGEHHPSRTPDTPLHVPGVLPDPGNSDSSESVETRDVEPSNGSERPALDEQAKHLHPSWTDPYFRRLFLIALSVFLIGIIAVLEAIYYISQHNQGLATASEDMHYIWTYGPTFVLTMVAALWGQLEQRGRQIIPWRLMSSGETSAQDSFMLNYLTSSTLGSLARSFKRKHYLVSIGICGSLILRLMIIFASGLLRLEYRSLTQGRDLDIGDIFDLTKQVQYIQSQHDPVTNALDYWAILKYGLPYHHGTTSQFAVQSFASGDDSYDQLTGEVLVFESSLEDCWSFNFTYNYRDLMMNPALGDPWTVGLEQAAPASLMEDLWPWCYASHGNYGRTNSVADGILPEFVNLTQLIYKCTNSTSVEDQEHRILFTSEYWLSNGQEASGIMCQPKYSLTRRAVTNDTQIVGVQDNLMISEAITETLDLGIPPLNITGKIIGSLDGEYGSNVSDLEWNLWYTMMNVTQPQNNLLSFRNTSLVVELWQRMWKGVSAYVVKRDYTSPSDETINGTATSIQGRVCVQELSLRLVESLITLVLALVVALCFLRPGTFHRDPTSLGIHAIILARSPGLMGVLQGYGAASEQTLEAKLSGYLASIPLHHSPKSPAIALYQSREESETISGKSTADDRDRREWWIPMSVRLWFRMCLMTAILVIVIALEVLLQVSIHENGLGDISLHGYLKYTWSFLPSLVLVLLGLLFSMVDSTARTLHSFQLLWNGRATIEDLLHDHTRQISLVAVVYAVWKRQFVLLWAIIPSLIAPILTVITSGLYTVAPVPFTYDAELELKEWFQPEKRTINDMNGNNPGNFDVARNTFGLTQFSGMSYPQWTQGEYAFASFGADNLHSYHGNDSSLYVMAHVPATRVNLNCSAIGHYAKDTFIPSKNDFRLSWLPIDPRPLGCHTPPKQNSTTGQRDLYLRTDYSINVEYKILDTSWGYNFTLLLDEYDNYINSNDSGFVSAEYHTNESSVCRDRREHHFIGLGYGTESLSLLHCVPYVEALWVTAGFSLPDLSLVSSVPIAPDRGSAVSLSNAAGMTANLSSVWDVIIGAMLEGSSGMGQLTGLPSDPDNNTIRRFIAALESTTAEYFAQVLNFNYRLPLGDNEKNASASSASQNLLTPDGQPATGTVTDHTRLRLIQNAISTRILQSLLGVMGACLVASTALGRGARVIPRDPGSIASRMAYFADGEIWRRVPVGADRWTDEQIKKHGLGMSGGRLLLKWWGGDDREESENGTRGKKFAVDSTDRKGS